MIAPGEFARPFFGFTLRSGVVPVRAYIEDPMNDVLGGTRPLACGRRDRRSRRRADGYWAVADREAITALVRP